MHQNIDNCLFPEFCWHPNICSGYADGIRILNFDLFTCLYVYVYVCVVYAEMGFTRKEYEFLSEIGLSSRNFGCYVDGTWKAHGPVITTLNPANNQVASHS